jgi:hypothetical protein
VLRIFRLCALADRLRVQCQITTSSARPSLRRSRRRRGRQFLLRRLATGHGQRAHKRQSKSNHFSSLTASSLDQSAQIGAPILRHWPSLPEGGLRAKPGTQLSPFRPRPPIRAESGRGRHSAEREGSPGGVSASAPVIRAGAFSCLVPSEPLLFELDFATAWSRHHHLDDADRRRHQVGSNIRGDQ